MDPAGRPEKELAEQFRHRAEEVENAEFHRLANTLRVLAGDYDKDAERIVSEYQQREPS